MTTSEPALDSEYVYEIKDVLSDLALAVESTAEAAYDMRKNAPELMTPEEHAAAFVALDAACHAYLARRGGTATLSQDRS